MRTATGQRALGEVHSGPKVRAPRLPKQWNLKAFALGYGGIAGSLFFHAAVLGLALATYTVGKQIIGQRSAIIVTDETIIDGAKTGGAPNPGNGAGAMQPPAALDGPRRPSDTWTEKYPEALGTAIMGHAPGTAESVIGIGDHALGGQGITEGGSATVEAPFGMPGGDGIASPRSAFMGSSGNATRIVYLCDCSGSMTDRMPMLLNELERSVKNLVPIQAFNVIFSSSGEPQMFANDLVPANSLNKEKLRTFLAGVQIHADTGPRRALEIAFGEKPDLIYLLTDGDFNIDQPGDGRQSDAVVVQLIRQLNGDGHVRVNTIAFSSADPESAEARSEYVQALKTIAEQSGGTFRFVSSSRVK